MTALGAGPINRAVLYLSHMRAATMYQWPGVHLDPPLAAATEGRQHRSSSVPEVTWSRRTRILVTDM